MTDGFAFIMFDLQMKAPRDTKEYRSLKSTMKILGYLPIQYSVYCHYLKDIRSYQGEVEQIAKSKFGGNIKMLKLTRKQFDDINVISGTGIDSNIYKDILQFEVVYFKI